MTAKLDADRNRFWTALIAEYRWRFDAWLRKVPCSADERREIAWDAWELAVERESELIAASNPWTVLSKCLQDICRERTRVWRHERPGTYYELDSAAEPPLSDTDAEHSYNQLCDDTLSALTSLSTHQRLAVDFRFRWNWPYEFVAAAIDCKEATARVHAKRGLDRLRAMLRKSAVRGSSEGVDDAH